MSTNPFDAYDGSAAGHAAFLGKAAGAAGAVAGAGKMLPWLGRAGSLAAGLSGPAFGIMGVLQLLQMLSSGEGGSSDRQGDAMASQAFLADPMLEEEGKQMATRNSLNGGLRVSGSFGGGSRGLGDDMSDQMFLDDIMARHGQVMRQQARRSPPTTAEIAMAAGLM